MGPREPLEAGDARFLGKMSRREKFPLSSVDFQWKGKHHHDISISNSTMNIVAEAPYNRLTFIESGTNESATLYIDNCGFPYYRSNKSSCRVEDAVLVKDVGVSCNLINEKPSVENYLMKRLKLEYNELSSITRKITAYTKDILSNLSIRERKKNKDEQRNMIKRPVASEYFDDNGKPCLKLRLQEVQVENDISSRSAVACGVTNSQKGEILQISSSILVACEAKEQKDNTNTKPASSIEKADKIQHEKACQIIFPSNTTNIGMNSSSCSSSSVYNYLMASKLKFSRRTESKSTQVNNSGSSKRIFSSCNESINKKRSNSVIITNWQEISRATENKNRAVDVVEKSSILRQKTNNYPKDENKYSSVSLSPDENKCVCDTKFQTINIRILRRF